MDEKQLVKLLCTTPPSCLRDFRVTPTQLPEPFDDNPCSVWQLACDCGNNQARFLGYPLKDYNAEYRGPECFISPLGFECTACRTVIELLDTDRHGYHADVARRDGGIGSAKRRGKGPRKAFVCSGCGGDKFEVTVGFVFWYPDELIDVDGKWEELFNVFLCYCKCVGCGHLAQPTDFGKL